MDKSVDELRREDAGRHAGAIRIAAEGSAPPPLIVTMPDGSERTYATRAPSAEDLVAAGPRLEALRDSGEAPTPRAWLDLLGLFLPREDAVRFFREQTLGTILRTIRAITERQRISDA